jgi:nucleoside phosphorylase
VSGTRGTRPIPDLGEDILVDPVPIAVVLTAISVEYEEMRKHLFGIQEEVHPAGTIFEIGRLLNGPWRVVLARTGQGNSQAATIAERAISQYRPALVMLVGVAGRLHDDLSLGDVVVARKIYAVHGGKEDDAGFRPRPKTWVPDHEHVQRAEYIAANNSWKKLLPERFRARVKAVVRAIASGEVVLDSVTSPYARTIKQYFGDAAAIEMEGAGVALASQLNKRSAVVLRGISDFADGQKEVTDRTGGQRRAARNAAAFAVALLAELVPERRAAAVRSVADDLLCGTTDQRTAAVRELADSRHADVIPLLVKGFEATIDPDVTLRVVWALSGLGTVAAREALRTLNPRNDFERLTVHDALEHWRER